MPHTGHGHSLPDLGPTTSLTRSPVDHPSMHETGPATPRPVATKLRLVTGVPAPSPRTRPQESGTRRDPNLSMLEMAYHATPSATMPCQAMPRSSPTVRLGPACSRRGLPPHALLPPCQPRPHNSPTSTDGVPRTSPLESPSRRALRRSDGGARQLGSSEAWHESTTPLYHLPTEQAAPPTHYALLHYGSRPRVPVWWQCQCKQGHGDPDMDTMPTPRPHCHGPCSPIHLTTTARGPDE